MRGGGWLWITMLVVALLQTTYLAAWRPLGAVPDLALVVLVFIALAADPVPALITALVGGVVLDVAAGGRFGLSSLVFILVAGGLAYLRSLGVAFGFWLSILVVGLASLLFGLVQLLAVMLSHGLVNGFGGRLILTILLDLGLAIVLGRPLTRLCRLLLTPAGEVAR